MTNRNAEVPPGEGGNFPPVSSNDQEQNRAANKVYKTGPLFISSKGIGWTSWKKRWFVLTRTSLVFFRSDPTAAPQKGGEANLTLGGIDLNSSGSVVVKEDKKLLTMLFPDGRDGRTFTLKAETLEDLLEWKTALDEALANAPSAALMVGQNGVFQANGADASSEQSKDRPPMKSLVIGQPVLLALEEIDGTPSFLEKALKFLEEHGLKVEGILRQAAYVDDVERRIREYEQGKVEFSADEDAHVIADCIKYILRELPSSPVPASCCSALLDACRVDRGNKVNAIRSAILETFPEPNRRLLQRILVMMRHVVAFKNENRMSTSAVAACMAPLLLRPLLSGECELEHTIDLGGDGSLQLLQAAAAANHAQAIVITLIEEYDNIFGEGSVQPELYSDSDGSGSGSEELTDDDGSYEGSDYDDEGEEECEEDDGDDADEGSDADIIEDSERASNATSETGNDGASKVSSPRSPELGNALETKGRIDSTESNAESSDMSPSQNSRNYATVPAVQRQALLGRVPGKKKKSIDAVGIAHDDDAELERLEATKTDLQNRIAEEAKVNQVLQEGMEKRRGTLHERRLALEKEVARLQELLEKEQELRMIFAAQLTNPQQSIPSTINKTVKTKLEEIAQIEVDVMNLKQKAADIEAELNKQREQNMKYHTDAGIPHQKLNYQGKLKDKAEGDKDKDKKNDFQLAVNKPLLNFNSPAASFAASVESLLATSRPATIPKKSGSKTEGATTTSALSKLTNRLNFLKEQSLQPPEKPGQNNTDREKSESSSSSSSGGAPDRTRNKVSPRTGPR
ncbi:rho GTPase-activating protein REN1-like isoform X2 [Ipomoea triloba]|uniref:rho GTPase-activating protein REN1-like isoform X2 n=1 Tax=Ipomoea triloba TaxID=35885 RepID=UPI00125E95C3|nr:rho GTPase-activating protein REN1-like isoform X2 [Ipomoea triloba]